MISKGIFFDNQIQFGIPPSYQYFAHRSENLHSVAWRLKKVFILVDQYTKKNYLFSHNPALAPLFDAQQENSFLNETKFVEKIGLEYLPDFCRILRIINDHIRTHTGEDDNVFYFSFHFPVIVQGGGVRMCVCKVFPYLYSDNTVNRVPWITYYQCDPSNHERPGQLTLHYPKEKSELFYLLNKKSDTDAANDFLTLKKSDLEIFELAGQGFSESETATALGISVGALKRIKSAIMLKINTQSTAQTIAILYQQGFL